MLLALVVAALPALGGDVWDVQRHRLPNGLEVFVKERRETQAVEVRVVVKVGHRYEKPLDSGLSHLLEHMLFKGTPNHPGIFQLLSSRGAQFNGSTWLDRTNYFETLPANDENLEFMISMEADRLPIVDRP